MTSHNTAAKGPANHSNPKEMSLTKQLVLFSIPLILGALLQQMFNWADAFILGNVAGEAALGAVGATVVLTQLLVMLLTGFSSGVSILSARYFGAGEHHKQRRVLGSFLAILLAVGLVLAVIGFFFSGQILLIMETPAAILEDGAVYMHLVLLGMPWLAIYNVYAAILRGMGNSRSPFVCLAVAGILNVILDYVFVAVLNAGVAGAAWATVLTQALSAILVVIITCRKYPDLHLFGKLLQAPTQPISENESAAGAASVAATQPISENDTAADRRLWDPVIVREGLALAIPITIKSMLTGLGSVLLQNFMNGFGEVTVAAITTSYRVDSALLLPVINTGVGISTMVSQSVGAGDTKRARQFFSKGVLLMLLFSGIMALFIWFMGGTMVSIFGVGPEAASIGLNFFRRLGSFYPIFGVMLALSGYLEGRGDVFAAGAITVSGLLVRIALSYSLVGIFDNMVIAWAEGFSWCYMLVVFLLRKWRYDRTHEAVTASP
ncbi:MAG: MATE family efflux transporter [Lachnospiraceae bacterium]|nr:MATE family efflux transporter [Lachnospiraceae bacterium]